MQDLLPSASEIGKWESVITWEILMQGAPTQSRASQSSSSSSRRSTGSGGAHNLEYYVTRFRKGLHPEGDDQSSSRSSFCGDDYDQRVSPEMFLLEKAALRNRIESGCLIVCDVRVF